MNDSLYEHIVARKPRLADMVVRILMIIATLLVTYLGFALAGAFAFFALFGMILLSACIVFPRLNVEYEYSLLNHYLDISIIYSKSKRDKNKTEINIQKADIIAPTGSPRLASYHPGRTLDYSSGNRKNKTYSIMISNDQIIIEPDEKMVQQMKDWMGQKMFLD